MAGKVRFSTPEVFMYFVFICKRTTSSPLLTCRLCRCLRGWVSLSGVRTYVGWRVSVTHTSRLRLHATS